MNAAAFARAIDPDATDPLPKRWREGGGRLRAPEDLAAALRPRLARFGVTRVARVTRLDRIGIECVSVVRPGGLGLSVLGGKGVDRAAAWVSGAMEAVEVAAAESPDPPLRFAAADAIARAVAPLDLVSAPRARALPDPSPPILWAPAVTLRGGAPAVVPFDLVHARWLAAERPADPLFAPSTNGLASGSHPAEATLHGLCELVERDACALFPRLAPEARAARRIDPGSIDHPPLAAMLDRVADAGLDWAVWDATTDVGLPVALCAIAGRGPAGGPPGFGAGCHPSRSTAGLRAVTEAAQTRLVAMAGARDDLDPAQFGDRAAAHFRWAFEGLAAPAGRDWRALPTFESDDLRADLRAAATGVEAAGCGPVLALDISPAPDLAVVRVFAAGLEPAGGPEAPGARAARAAACFA